MPHPDYPHCWKYRYENTVLQHPRVSWHHSPCVRLTLFCLTYPEVSNLITTVLNFEIILILPSRLVKLNTSIVAFPPFCLSSSNSPALASNANMSTIVMNLQFRGLRSSLLILFGFQSYPVFTVQKERRDGWGRSATSFLPAFTRVCWSAHCEMRSYFGFLWHAYIEWFVKIYTETEKQASLGGVALF